MLQERKPRFCGIFATFFQSETQLLMTVSDLLGFFSRNYFLEGGFTFQWGGIWFSVEWGLNFKRRGAPLGALALMTEEIFKKHQGMEGAAHRPLWKTLIYLNN